MVICPWCGTYYDTFQSNCKNCGGPIQIVPESPAPEEPLQAPPPAPRSISDRYAFKLLLTDGTAIAGLVLAIVGGVFSFIGLLMTVLLVTALIGVIFALVGLPMLLVGGGLLYWRYQDKQKLANVLKFGQAVRGEITGLEENLMMRVNGRSPWVIQYQFRANGQTHSGSVSTLRGPTPQIQPGKAYYVLYNPDAPELNALYPHP
jgi:hypothetical protein